MNINILYEICSQLYMYEKFKKYNIEYYIVKIKTKVKVVFMFRVVNAKFIQPHYYLPHHYHIYMCMYVILALTLSLSHTHTTHTNTHTSTNC